MLGKIGLASGDGLKCIQTTPALQFDHALLMDLARTCMLSVFWLITDMQVREHPGAQFLHLL